MCACVSYELKLPLHEIRKWKISKLTDQYCAIKVYLDIVKESAENKT